MQTCKTCAYWEGPSNAESIQGCCRNDKLSGNYSDDGLNEMCEHSFGLMTGKDFGCIHHETEMGNS